MNFDRDPEEEVFRQEVQSFVADMWNKADQVGLDRNVPLARRSVEFWTRALHGKGYLVPTWPSEWGGKKWSAKKIYILSEELVKGGVPDGDRIALDLVAPVIYTYGTPEQKQRLLPRILNADDFWCQGFSEPQAGSDLSLIRTRAVRDGDFYIVNGQKLWTTNAHNADMMFALVRVSSGGKLQQGLSFLLMNMRAPGITVRPVITIDGGHSVNEVFLQDVRVPVKNLIGEEGKGWQYARYLLSNERVAVAAAPQTRKDLGKLKMMARTELRNGRPLIEDTMFRAKLSQLEIDLVALEFSIMRMIDMMATNDPAAERLGPVLKIRGSELRQRVSELQMLALGERGLAFFAPPMSGSHVPELVPPGPEYAPGVTSTFMFRRSTSIAAGSNEIQRNILATSGLAL
ncbi:acyl-CoA dehydrogenase family protein [Massilia sp. UMI-21]|nr:acyl-CoA dehydrogenase family protein [Massilia sp. UMI-21]